MIDGLLPEYSHQTTGRNTKLALKSKDEQYLIKEYEKRFFAESSGKNTVVQNKLNYRQSKLNTMS